MKFTILSFLVTLKKRYFEILSKNNTLYEIFVLNVRRKKRDKKRNTELRSVLQSLMQQEPFPLPTAIEIETLNRCNGDCDFCPVNKHLDKREYKVMDDELFYSIIGQLKELGYSGYISAYSNNEPLLDKRIYGFVKHIKEELPNSKNFLFTNGILLNLEKFKELIEHLDYMVIDNYYEGEKHLYPRIKEIAEYCLKDEELKKKVKIQLIDKHMLRNNRAGNAKNRRHIYRIKSSCLWPFSQIVIRPTGQLSLCCNDALGQMTMGDLTKEKLIDIWRGEKYKALRQSLLNGRKDVKLCYNCDSFGLDKRDTVLAMYNIGKNWKEIEDLIGEGNNA